MRLERLTLYRSAVFGKAMWSCSAEALGHRSASKSHASGCHSPLLRRLTVCLRTQAAHGALHSQACLNGRSGACNTDCRAFCCASADSGMCPGSRKTQVSGGTACGYAPKALASAARLDHLWRPMALAALSMDLRSWTCAGATASAAPAAARPSRKELTKMFEPAENEQRLYDWCLARSVARASTIS